MADAAAPDALIATLTTWQGLAGLALATVVVLVFVARTYLRAEHRSRLPRGFTPGKFVAESPRKASIQPHRDGFSKKKVPTDLDAIVIGSGIGGLSCAALMSRAGKRVLVLEQHYIAGGSTHAFEDGGYEFDTGIHYIGNIAKRAKYLNLMTNGDNVEWDKMGHEDPDRMVYDEVNIGDGAGLSGEWKRYEMRSGEHNFIEDLAARFPEERAAIEEYVRLCKEVSKKELFFNSKIIRPAWLARLLNRLFSRKFFKWCSQTALEVVSGLTANKDLQAALLACFGDYGGAPSVSSFFLHASVANHYFSGGWFPRGGSTVIAKKLVPAIEKTGGRVLVRRGVASIVIENGRAVGVRMAGDEVIEIRARQIISGAGVLNTYKKLLPREVVPRGLVEKLDRIGTSCSMLYLFVGLDGTPEENRLRSSNIWHWPERDYAAMLNKFFKDPEHAPIPLFIGFPCAKDSTWNARFPGKSNAVILTIVPFEPWAKYEHERQGHRSAEYQAKKEMYKERILEGLYHYYPHLNGKVRFTSVGSPVTFNYYIGSQRGEVYGLESRPERYCAEDWLRPETDIPGLYLTGQDVATLGVTGAMMGGILTAHAALGYGGVTDIASGRNLIEDIMHLDEARAKAAGTPSAKKRFGLE